MTSPSPSIILYNCRYVMPLVNILYAACRCTCWPVHVTQYRYIYYQSGNVLKPDRSIQFNVCCIRVYCYNNNIGYGALSFFRLLYQKPFIFRDVKINTIFCRIWSRGPCTHTAHIYHNENYVNFVCFYKRQIFSRGKGRYTIFHQRVYNTYNPYIILSRIIHI